MIINVKKQNNDTEPLLYENLPDKPKLNGIEIEGDKKSIDYNLTYLKDFQDNTSYQTKEQINDHLQNYMDTEILPGYRDKIIIPDIYNTGLKENDDKNQPIIFTDVTTIPAVGKGTPIGIITKGEGSLLQLFADISKNTYFFNGLYTEKDVAEEFLVENYDFSKVNIGCLHNDNFPHKIKVVFKNCLFNKYNGFLTRSGMGNLKAEFNYCTFEGTVKGSQMVFNHCKFHADTADALNPFCDVFVNDSLIYDLQRKSIPNELHLDGVQIYGLKDSFAENIHFKNVRFSIPNFNFGPENKTYVNGAILLQLEFCSGRNFSFEDIVADYGGQWHPFFSTSKNGMKSTEILFKNTLASDYYPEGEYGSIKYNEELNKPYLSELNTLHELYVSSVWKENNKVYLSCTNTSIKKEKRFLTVITDEGKETFEINRCPSQDELKENEKYSHYRYKDMPYDIKIELKIPADRCSYVICYEENKQIRFVNFSQNRVFLPYKKNLNYETLSNKPSIDGQEINGTLKSCQIIDNNLGRTISETIHDVNLIPDSKNTGLYNVQDCINNVVTDIAIPEYNGLYFTTSEDKNTIYLDFNWDSNNRYIIGTGIVENIDFDKNYPNGFNFHELRWHQGKEGQNYHLIFKNCKFNSVIANKTIISKTLKIDFVNCSFRDLTMVPGTYYNCSIGLGANKTPIIATSYSTFNNCFIYGLDKIEVQESPTAGVLIDGLNFVEFNRCRFELPNLANFNDKNIKSVLEIRDNVHNPIYQIKVKECYLNGGKNLINCYTSSPQEIEIQGNYYGENHNENIFSDKFFTVGKNQLKNMSEERSLKNKKFLKLLISSVWKDEANKLHFLVSNESLQSRKLSVYTNNGVTDFVIPGQVLAPSSLDILPVDLEKVLEENDPKFIVFYDEGHQIRFVNYTNDYIEEPFLKNNIPGYKEISVTTQKLQANTRYKFTIPANEINITLEPAVGYAEYDFVFTTSENGCNLTIPTEIIWNGNKVPTLEANKKYEVIISEGIAYIGKGVTVS